MKAKLIQKYITHTYTSHAEKVFIVNRILQDNGSKYYSVKFIKADNTIRDMICGLPERKGLKGKDIKYNPKSTQERVTECFKGYRSYNKEQVLQLKANGTLHTFKYKAA